VQADGGLATGTGDPDGGRLATGTGDPDGGRLATGAGEPVGDGLATETTRAWAAVPWPVPAAAMAAPPPARASPAAVPATQATFRGIRRFLDSIRASSRSVIGFGTGKYVRPGEKLCRHGSNLGRRPAVYAQAGIIRRDGIGAR
jgi:hypothetical protein